jgi:hypothetical protein
VADTAQTAKHIAHGPWVDRAARLGFVARGVVYLLIGILAVQIARGRPHGQSADKQGALAVVADQPFGRAVLVLLAVGMFGYALWRFSEAVWGRSDETDPKKRTVKRLSSAGKGVIYAAFGVTAISFAASSSKAAAKGSNGSQTEHSRTATLLGWPGGRVLVAAAGLAVVAGGLYLVWRGIKQKFEKKLNVAQMSPNVRRAAEVLGTVGTAARGAVFVLAGLLLVKAAVDFNPNEAQGIDGTLRKVAEQSHGQVLLIIAGIGFAIFGLYSFVEARYRNLHP